MNCEYILYNIEERLFENIKKRDFKRLDDFKVINYCSEILEDEIEKNIDENNNLSKKTVFDLIHNYFNFYKNNNINLLNYKKFSLLPYFLIIFLLYITCLLFFKDYVLDFENFYIQSSSFLILNSILFLIIFLSFIIIKIKQSINYKENEINLKKIFILKQAFLILEKKLQKEEKDMLLEPELNIHLEEEEINCLLSDEFAQPEIETRVYNKKSSMERRKRRKTR